MIPSALPHRPSLHLPRTFAILLGIAATLAPETAQAWSATLQIGTESNDNVTKSIKQEKSDFALTAALDISTLHLIDRDWQLSYGGSVQTSAWQDYSGLNLSELGVHATLRRKFGLGPYAPRLEVRAEVAHQLSKVHEWSGNWVRGSTTLSKRFTPEWQASLSGSFDQLYANRDVYSTKSTTATATIDFDPTEEWRFSLSMSYTDGDHLSWCRNRWSSFAGTVQWKDGIFGSDWFPYQSNGHTISGSISVSRAIGLNSSLSLQYDASEARALKNHVYRDHIIRLQFTHSF